MAKKVPAPVTAPAPSVTPAPGSGDSLLAPLPSSAPAPVVQSTIPSADSGDPASFVPTPLNLDPVDHPEIVPPGPSSTPAPRPGELTPEEIARRREENTSLRTQLEESNRLRTERDQELKDERARIAGIEAERERFKTERESIATEFQGFRASLTQSDPMKDDRVIALNRQFEGKVKELANEITMEGGKGAALRPLVPDLLKKYRGLGEPESEGFEDRRRALNDSIETNFPDHAKDIRAMLRNGIDLQDEMNQRITHLQKNGDTIRADREKEQFMQIDQHYSAREKLFFKPAPEVVENDPYNAEVIVTQLLDSSDEAKERKKGILIFCRALALPPAPIDAEQLAKMSIPDQNAFFTNRNASKIKIHDRLQSLLPTALASQIVLPGIYKELLEARRELLELRGSAPPPPNGQDLLPDSDTPPSIEKFEPSNSTLKELGRV